MGRSKNKNKLQLKYQNSNNNNDIISNSKIKDDENLLDGNESDNSENVLNNPILLNHINDIQNVNENILLWNDDDVIDDNKTKVFHEMVKSEIIKKSIKKSAFSKYLKSNLKEINKINIFALSGIIMKNEDSPDKNNVILNEISSNNYSIIESKKQNVENLNILDLPEEIENVDRNSCERMKLSEMVASSDVSDDRPVRRSGRCVKINYKEMLNVQIFEVVRSSELQHNEGISSPRKRSKMRREMSKRLSVNDLEDEENEENDKEMEREEMERNGEEEDGEEERSRKGVIRKRFSKDMSRECVLCRKAVMGSKRYLNLCYKCMVASSKLIGRMGLSASENGELVVCLAVPACPTRREGGELCDACRVQRLIERGVQWGPDYSFMRSLDLQQLRSAESVARARLANQKRIESWLEVFQSGGTDSRKSCVLKHSKPLWSPCKWDIRYFQLISIGKICDLCRAEPTESNNHIYAILPNQKHAICHRCLATAHNAYNSSAGSDCVPPCSPPCTNLQQCSFCLLNRIAALCPLDSIKYRFSIRSSSARDSCEICLRNDPSLIALTRAGNLVCHVCIARVKLFHFKQMSPCEQGTCPIGQCDACLVDLAQRVVDLHQMISHFHKYDLNSLLSPLLPPPPPAARKTSKRSIDHEEDVAESICKRACTAAGNEDHRPRRIIKSTQFNDFIVDKSILRKSIDRTARNSSGTAGYDRKSMIESEGESVLNKLEKREITIDEEQIACKLDNDNCGIIGDEIKEENCVEVEEKQENGVDKSENNYENVVEDKSAIGEEKMEQNDEKRAVIIAGVTEELMKPCRRIKQAMPTVQMNARPVDEQQQQQACQMGTSAPEPAPERTETAAIPRTNGPRVKQVSRQHVNADLNLELSRQKCVIKRGNRIVKKPESMSSYIVDYEDRSGRRIIEDDSGDEEKDARSESKDPEMPPFHAEKSISFGHETVQWDSAEMRCGVCSGCARNRCCGKCDPCLLNKSQKRKTETCVKMVCSHYRGLLSSRHNGQSQSADARASSYKLATCQPLDSSTDNADKSIDEIVPPDSKQQQINGTKDIYVCGEVYRDSDSDDLSSEEEQLDPELDSIHTVKGDLITTGLAHEGGFPVITSVKAQPNKVLCFSCGSGGDQMIHCVSCAEPFHFFCIEYQFRPKSKEMFVCRNCTKCHTCQAYGSDLKCIKCQLGFHPRCVMKYPPSKSEDRSNWACYKCAMCLHCGAKAEDMMNQINRNDYHIDWSKDPWQCGRCARARKEGQVCPECGRAYQSGLETLECGSCARMVHRQCSGLTEDEYEIFKCDPEANRESSSFTCSKCAPPEAEDDQKKRIRLKRQCKESNLKKYCERGVSRKMNELINKGETHEEMLLEQHNLSDVVGHTRCSISSNQYDGVDDDDGDEFERSGLCGGGSGIMMKEYDTVTNGSPSNQANSTMFYSSESTGECDMEPLNIMDLEPSGKAVDVDVSLETNVVLPTRTKIGIFSRLNASDFISPKHLIMEALARISVKLSRYPIHNQIHKIYDKFLVYIQDLNDQIFPWVDFSNCFETVQIIVKKYAGRVKLMLQSITDNVRESRNREFDVFSSSISEIEEKLSNSFQRGREEFIIFHSEQHLTALKRSMECRSSSSTTTTANKDLYTNYKLAFRTDSNTATCEKDVRICALCGFSGDDGLEGRLIYGGLDVWVHVNCALWSDDVYEKEDGALVNVDLAIKQGESSICSSCNKCGATVRCSANDSLIDCGKSCSNIYHFACAFNSLPDAVFTESRSFYCSTSHNSCDTSVEVLSLEDMPILRRIYLPQGCLGGVSMACSDGISSDEIVVTIGNLRINCLGKIDSCSDMHKIYLCPLEYQARRLYWSMYELDSLVMYSMSIQKEINVNKFTDGVSSVVTVPVSNPNPIPHRRRMIEMPEHRVAKRPKAMGGEHEIIYEMDDAGNLQPITGSVIKMKPPSFSNFQYPETIKRKVNRRFPMNYSNPNRMVECKKDIDRFPIDKASLTISLPSTSCNRSNPKLKTNNDQSSLTTRPPKQIARKGVESPAVLPQQVIPQSVALPVNQVKPVVLQLNKGSSNLQQRNLPQSILNQLKLNKNISKPLTFINVSQPINTLSSMNPATIASSKTVGNKLVKLVKIQDGRRVQGNLITSTNQLRVHQQVPPTNFHPQTVRIIPSSHAQSIPQTNNSNVSRVGTLPSVLRTALTDNSNQSSNLYRHNHPFVQQRPQITSVASSSYHISACGSLLAPTTFPQFDGEADDASVLAADDWQNTNISESICGYSDQDNASTATAHRIRPTNKSIKSPLSTANRYSLKFVIHGFKESKTPKACWSYLARKISQMRKMEGLDEYDLKIGDGWSKFGLDHRHVIYLIEQMVGAFQCSNYDFKFHKSRANLLRQKCLPVIPPTNGCARFSPWISTKPEHFATDPLAFLLSKSNLPPKNHAPAGADQNDDNPDPDEDYLQTLASQFRNLQNGVQSREQNVRVCCSNIHGRGLFARRQFDAHEIIIEYVGEVIRSVLSDVRETEYQRTGVDCYMFRLDHDFIVDATCKGNAARFINHSCHPNCYAKVVRFEGEKHIIIIAQRQIYKGEELTYDYRFPIEDDKLPCTCGSFSCKKYLN